MHQRLWLKAAIVQSGRTQRDICAATHITEFRLSSIIHGWVQPRHDERLALQRLLGVAFERTATEPLSAGASGD
jgi:hypothetical protein